MKNCKTFRVKNIFALFGLQIFLYFANISSLLQGVMSFHCLRNLHPIKKFWRQQFCRTSFTLPSHPLLSMSILPGGIFWDFLLNLEPNSGIP